MYPETTRQLKGNQYATSMSATQINCLALMARKYSHRVHTQASTITEYQERFCSPLCHKAVASASQQHKDPPPPLRSTDVTPFRSYHATHRCIKIPPMPPSEPQRCQKGSRAPHKGNQMETKMENYTSVYQSNFPAWNLNKVQPYRPTDTLKVVQGLVVPEGVSKKYRLRNRSVQVAARSPAAPWVQETKPLESVTTYRSDYVKLPVEPRSLKPAVCSKPKVTWNSNQQLLDEAGDLFQRIQTWSLGNKSHGQQVISSKSRKAHRVLPVAHA